MNDWYEKLRSIKSLGSQTETIGGLAGLHDARRIHNGQFWTTDAIAAFMWGLVREELEGLPEQFKGGKVAVLDNSVGSGRLLQFCKPGEHFVAGLDIHQESLSQVQEVFEQAGFECDFRLARMEECRARDFTIALINPPFSVHLESPLMASYGCTTYGKFGPRTSAQSDYYAVAQAVEAATAVVALLPRTVADQVWAEPELVDIVSASHKDDKDDGNSGTRLYARFDLPKDSFKEEGAVVDVSVLVFGAGRMKKRDRRWEKLTSLVGVEPMGPLGMRTVYKPILRLKTLENTGPTITLPVTGDNTVRVAHDRRHIRLKFRCGFTQARVMNAVLRERIYSTKEHRLPNGYRYSGQGQLDIEVHLMQDDAKASILSLLRLIEQQDASVETAPGFWRYVERSIRRHRRAAAPLSHTVWRKAVGANKVNAKCTKVLIVDRDSWASPVINVGDLVSFERTDDGRFEATLKDGHKLSLSFEELNGSFAQLDGLGESGWVQVHAGLLALEPELAKWWRARLEKSVVKDFLTWDFQRDDLIELLMCPRGAVAAWSMGLGKTRLAVALILLSGVKRSLVTTEAYLVPEFVEQLEALNVVPKSEWKVIKCRDDLNDLRRINIISNELLRMPLKKQATSIETDEGEDEGQSGDTPVRTKKKPQRELTYAHLLRRRIGMAISDEGEFLANPRSAQSRALWRVSAQKRFVLTGTPIPNYPRDVLPILSYAAGDGTASQPWGYWGPYLEERFVNSVAFADRGIKRFIDEYVSLVWVTNEYAETLREGAKREIPNIGNLAGYREMLAPHVKRRVPDEPEVARYVHIPTPRTVVHSLPWDEAHLRHYLTVADDFAQWMDDNQRKKNLLVILLRFQAVLRALNIPQDPAKHVRSGYHGITSKQRFMIDRMEQLAKEGHKTMVYVHAPALADLLGERLRKQSGIEPLVLHGKISGAKRHRLIRDRFKFGDCPTMISTFGSVRAGENIPQATRVLLGSRDWTARVERQAIARALRPETKHEVTVEYTHIVGSADEYQDQMVRFKAVNCADAGLDWGTPEFESEDFLHLDTILGRFVEDLAERRGMKVHEMRELLKAGAEGG